MIDRHHHDPAERAELSEQDLATTTASTATRLPRSPGFGSSSTASRPHGELYGRALVVIAAEQHAMRLVVPASQRVPATRWSSHKDIAAKALKKLAGPHVPATLTRLEQAVKRAHAAYDKAETTAREQQRAERQPAEDDEPVGDELADALDEAA
jgi:hypothetical protein